MKILSRALFLIFLLIGALIAVSNAEPVQLALWPLPQVVIMPLYLLVVALLLLGMLSGLGLGWWAGRHYRRRARERGSEAARLEREVVRLRETLATGQAAPLTSAARAPRDLKAIERQSALVAPELGPPGRGPLAS
jgi:hypothetical protein